MSVFRSIRPDFLPGWVDVFLHRYGTVCFPMLAMRQIALDMRLAKNQLHQQMLSSEQSQLSPGIWKVCQDRVKSNHAVSSKALLLYVIHYKFLVEQNSSRALPVHEHVLYVQAGCSEQWSSGGPEGLAHLEQRCLLPQHSCSGLENHILSPNDARTTQRLYFY